MQKATSVMPKVGDSEMQQGLGAIAALILALLGTWFLGQSVGKSAGKKEMAQKVTDETKQKKAETEKALAEDAAKIVSERTAESDAINGFFNDFESKLKEAKATENVDYAIEAARQLAEKATQWQRRNK